MKNITCKNWILIWILGMTGQICWNIENSWFNTFVYDKIAPDPAIVSWMAGVSAVVSTFCAFLVGGIVAVVGILSLIALTNSPSLFPKERKRA